MTNVKLLSATTNAAVVHLPGRANPGLVLQGRTLRALRELASRAVDLLEEGDLTGAQDKCVQLYEDLNDYVSHYEGVLRDAQGEKSQKGGQGS